MNIDWENKPDWADVWVEDLQPEHYTDFSGWHYIDEKGDYRDNDGFWERDTRSIKVHYPPKRIVTNRKETIGACSGEVSQTVSYVFDETDRKQNATICEIGDAIADRVCNNLMDYNKTTPEYAQWRGPEDGLPPSGTSCEVYDNGGWNETFIVGVDDSGFCVYTSDRFSDDLYSSDDDPDMFRPIGTEEDQAVEDMQSIARKSGTRIKRSAARALYHSGYRKLDNPDASE